MFIFIYFLKSILSRVHINITKVLCKTTFFDQPNLFDTIFVFDNLSHFCLSPLGRKAFDEYCVSCINIHFFSRLLLLIGAFFLFFHVAMVILRDLNFFFSFLSLSLPLFLFLLLCLWLCLCFGFFIWDFTIMFYLLTCLGHYSIGCNRRHLDRNLAKVLLVEAIRLFDFLICFCFLFLFFIPPIGKLALHFPKLYPILQCSINWNKSHVQLMGFIVNFIELPAPSYNIFCIANTSQLNECLAVPPIVIDRWLYFQ